jgi:hypothetical protein
MRFLELPVYDAVRLSNMLKTEQPDNPDPGWELVDYPSQPAQQRLVNMIDAQILHNLPLVLWMDDEQVEILTAYTCGMVNENCEYTDPIPLAFIASALR